MAIGLGSLLLLGFALGSALLGHKVWRQSRKAALIIPAAVIALTAVPFLAAGDPEAAGAAYMLTGLLLGFLGPITVGWILGVVVSAAQQHLAAPKDAQSPRA